MWIRLFIYFNLKEWCVWNLCILAPLDYIYIYTRVSTSSSLFWGRLIKSIITLSRVMTLWGSFLIDVNATEVYHRSMNASRRADSVGVDEEQADSLLRPSSAASPPLPQLQQRLGAALLVCSCPASLVCDAVDGQNQQIRSSLIPFCNRASLIWSPPARRRSPEESDCRGRLCGLNMWVGWSQPVPALFWSEWTCGSEQILTQI